MKAIKEALHAVGEFQSRLLLTTLYFFVLPIFSVIAHCAGDPLGLRDFGAGKQTWLKRQAAGSDLESVHRQY